MKLFFHPMSSSSRRVTLTAQVLGSALDAQLVELPNPAHRAELVKINPNNKVPVLIDGDFVLWESHAIMEYLCAHAPGQTLLPTELRARADVMRWLFWTSAHLTQAIGPITFERMWKKFGPGGDPDLAVIERHERFFHQAAAVLDQHLADRTWVAGNTLSLADLSIAATLMYRVPTQLPISGYKHVLAHLARVEALPAWQATEPTRNA